MKSILLAAAAALMAVPAVAQGQFCAIDNNGNQGWCFQTLSQCQNATVTGLVTIGRHACVLSGQTAQQDNSATNWGWVDGVGERIMEQAERGRESRRAREEHELRMQMMQEQLRAQRAENAARERARQRETQEWRRATQQRSQLDDKREAAVRRANELLALKDAGTGTMTDADRAALQAKKMKENQLRENAD
ncbi:MAG: hypothetical protein VXW22_15745 [Pseudomonadota bacterium]|nr:hypothetical protein [Pseudomonadota bacterium]